VLCFVSSNVGHLSKRNKEGDIMRQGEASVQLEYHSRFIATPFHFWKM
jgi:hypothetical protein